MRYLLTHPGPDTAGGALDALIDPRGGRIVSSSWAERLPLRALRLLHSELYLGMRGRVIVGLFGLGNVCRRCL